MSVFRKEDSSVAHIFGVQIDGVQVEYVNKVTGLEQKQEPIKYWQNTPQGQAALVVLPGPVQGGECQVTRATTGNNAFSQWIKNSFEGKMGQARKNITFIQMDYEKQPVRRFNLRNAWCCDRKFGDLEAGGTSPVEETITITYEEMKIEEA